jgi:DNA polymerase
MEKFFGPGRSISRIHGTTTRWRGVLCYALYHPAAALHQPGLKSVLEEDFARLPMLVAAEEAALAEEVSQPDEQAASTVLGDPPSSSSWNESQPKLF